MNTLPFELAKHLIKRKLKKQYTEWISTKSKDQSWEIIIKTPGLILDLPRKEAVPKFRLLTGHDCLAQHLNNIGIKELPNCTLCQQNVAMNGSHLSICPNLNYTKDIVVKYWDARRKMM